METVLRIIGLGLYGTGVIFLALVILYFAAFVISYGITWGAASARKKVK